MNKDYGFDSEFDDLDVAAWEPESTKSDAAAPSLDEVKRVAEKAGFTSREPSSTPSKEGQITIRGKLSVVEEFRNLAVSQEPKWPLGYTLERALEALKKELDS